ncbi:hypothetical protein C8R41DRAFT_861335 [Lentinula lateritia]|uniref:Secreted protein n=1 Tax=Lentinula lateritia TaxID=40482 RepID=A0ABQ8UW19_9AGAR|nr:hypothetical protein C8R41DRAFT_861335 [Lentinula lateritia]
MYCETRVKLLLFIAIAVLKQFGLTLNDQLARVINHCSKHFNLLCIRMSLQKLLSTVRLTASNGNWTSGRSRSWTVVCRDRRMRKFALGMAREIRVPCIEGAEVSDTSQMVNKMVYNVAKLP